MGSDQTNNYLHRELRWKMRSLKSDGEKEILACPECGRYYYFREWAPGGSDDAMVTTEHQDFYELLPYELCMHLYPVLEQTEADFLVSEGEAVIRGAIAFLKQDLSAKVHEVYTEAVLARERFAAEILKAAFGWLKNPPGDLILETKPFLQHRDRVVRERVSAALGSG